MTTFIHVTDENMGTISINTADIIHFWPFRGGTEIKLRYCIMNDKSHIQVLESCSSIRKQLNRLNKPVLAL